MNSKPASKSALALAVALLLLAGCATTLDVPPASAPVAPSTPLPSPEAILSGTAGLPPPPASQPVETAPPEAAAPQAAEPAPAEVITAPEPVDPLRPEVRLNPNDGDAQTDLWDRVRRGFRMPDLETELARDRTQWYASQPDYFMRMTERGSRYLFHIVEEVERRKMPTEMALLPFIESAFNPQAMSSAKASGMWQFMPSTGKHYSLKQNVFRDDRRDVLASTRAALDYLQKLHGMFGDWHLALAAYNWGEGSVSRAIAKNRKAGLPTDYTSLKMPRETQYYVPKLQAIKNLVAKPEAYGLALPAAANHPYFLSVPIERDMDVDLAARLSGMTLDDFKALNPQMNKPVILAAGTAQVLLPYDNANLFVRRLPLHRGPLASWTAWVAPKTVRPAEAAKQVGMSEEQLREVNRIPPRMLVQAGVYLARAKGAQQACRCLGASGGQRHDVAGARRAGASQDVIASRPQRQCGVCCQALPHQCGTSRPMERCGSCCDVQGGPDHRGVRGCQGQRSQGQGQPSCIGGQQGQATQNDTRGGGQAYRAGGQALNPRSLLSAGPPGRVRWFPGPRTPARCRSAHHAPGA